MKISLTDKSKKKPFQVKYSMNKNNIEKIKPINDKIKNIQAPIK